MACSSGRSRHTPRWCMWMGSGFTRGRLRPMLTGRACSRTFAMNNSGPWARTEPLEWSPMCGRFTPTASPPQTCSPSHPSFRPLPSFQTRSLHRPSSGMTAASPLVLQTGTRVLNDEPDQVVRRWSPVFRTQTNAAWPLVWDTRVLSRGKAEAPVQDQAIASRPLCSNNTSNFSVPPSGRRSPRSHLLMKSVDTFR